VWLTSGVQCRIASAPAPTGPDEWQAALDLCGRLAIESALSSQHQVDAVREERLHQAEARAARDSADALDLLAGAVVGPIVRSTDPTDRASSALSAAFIAARSAGLTIAEPARLRAMQEVDLGRDALTAAAEACTARPRTVDLAPSWWTVEGPALVSETKRGGFVALIWRGRGWVAIDPADLAVSTSVDEEVAASLKPKATELVPLLTPGFNTTRSLIRLGLSGSGRDIAAVLTLTVLIAMLAFVTPVVFGRLAASLASVSTRDLVLAMSILVLLLLAGTAWQLMRSLALLRARTRFGSIATGAVWDRMLRLRATWHESHTLGHRMAQSTAVNLASEGVPDQAITGLLDTVAILGSLAAVATTNPPLLAAVTVLVAVQLVVNTWFVRRGAILTAKRVTASADANGRLMETLGAVNRLKVSGAEERAFKRWAQMHAKLTSADLSLRRLSAYQMIVLGAWPLVGLIVIVAVSAASGASFGDFVTVQTAAGLATATIAMAAMSGSALLNSRAVLAKVEPVLAATPEGFGDGVNPGQISGGISVNDIVFRYEPGGPAVLDGVSFRVQPGEHVAIVGPSGCGKTTLMRILLGLEDPESGVIAVDGKDMASLDRPSARRQIGCVLQSSTLLPGPIRDNVDMGRGLTSSEIWEALASASVADDVRQMGMGLDTPVVDGGGTISGGQRQRVLLARALAGSPRMLLLDEATSALDNVTQAVVIEFLENLRLTRIVVAHRLSTIRTADRIIVMAGGRVSQQGTYDELMAEPGHFRDLAERQLT
jgi:ABC-type bacteriocin/lantibiotic exporter with double-glycine peptidase domain